MGKHSNGKHNNVQYQASNPGCVWNIFYVLDYHVWSNIKKMLKHKKHGKGRHVKCCENRKQISFEPDNFAPGALSDSEVNNFKDGRGDMKCFHRSFGKVQVKPIISEDEVDKRGFSSESSFQLINSYYHSDSKPDKKSSYGIKSINFQKGANNIPAIGLPDSTSPKTQKQLVANSISGDGCGAKNVDHLAKECNEVIDRLLSPKTVNAEQLSYPLAEGADGLVFRVNKELFLKLLQTRDSDEKKSFSLKSNLTKSISFPMPKSPHANSIRPSTLKHKQSEVWFSPKKGKKSRFDTQKQKIVGSMGSVMEQEPISPGFSRGKSQGWNQLVVNRFKHIKQKIKYALAESKKDSSNTPRGVLDNRTPSLESLDSITNGQNLKDTSESLTETRNPDNNFKKDRPGKENRSLNESLENYARLFEQNFSEQDTLSQSKSSKLASEDGDTPNESGQKSFRRNLSVPDVEPFLSSPFEETHDALSSKFLTDTVSDDCQTSHGGDDNEEFPVVDDSSPQKGEHLDSLANLELQDEIADISQSSENTDYPDGSILECISEGTSQTGDFDDDIAFNFEEKIASKEQDAEFTLHSSLGSALAGSALEATRPKETPLEEDFSMAPCDLTKLGGSEIRSTPISLADLFTVVAGKDGKVAKHIDHHFIYREKEDIDFSYLEYILKLTGFTSNDYRGFWHSLEQLLSPTLLKELQVHKYKELEFLKEDIDDKLMFDLVHEILVGIYEKSFAYFPRTFPLHNSICRSPMGQNLLEEVWKKVSWYLSLMPELDQSVEYVVGRDMEKDDSWMNCQMENDFVALELEDMILDELLEEIIRT